MGKPKAPKAPDYAAAATAQGTANTQSAIATNFLNQPNQVGPYGSMTYDYDNANGQVQKDGSIIPRTTVTTKLSPEQQRLYEQETGISTQLNDLAARGIGYVDDASQNPIDQSSLPGMAGSVGQTGFQTGIRRPTTGLVRGLAQNHLYGTAEGTSLGVKGAPTLGKYQQNSAGSNIPIQRQSAQTGYRTAAEGTSRGISGVEGLRGYKRSADPSGQVRLGVDGQPIQFTQGQSPDIQHSINGENYQDQYDYGKAEAAPKIGDFAGQRDKITEAMLSRLQPYIERDRESLRTRMANQGLGQGTEARGWEEQQFQRGVNDQRTAALLAGDQEQQNLFSNAMGIRQQAIGEATSQGNFRNNAAASRFAQNQARGNFTNQAQGQSFDQNRAKLQDFNSASGQMFNQGLAQGQFANTAQGQQFGQNQQAWNNANEASSRENADIFNANAANNAAQAQEFGQNQQAFQNYNTGTEAGNNQSFRQAELSNSAQAQQYAQSLQEMAASNAATGQGNTDAFQENQFNNQAQQQEYGQNQQDLENYNSSQQGNFQQNLAAAGFQNSANEQEFGQNDREAQMYNQGQEGIFRQGLSASQFQNQARQQAIQEADYFKNQPLNMLNALRSGGQVNLPQFGNVSAGSNIAPAPLYQGAQDQYSAAMDAYKQKMASFGAVVGAVGGLGSAGIAKYSDRRLKRNVTKVAELADGLGVYEYNYLWSDEPELGVMADEVARLRPEALGPVVGGFATVNYGAL